MRDDIRPDNWGKLGKDAQNAWDVWKEARKKVESGDPDPECIYRERKAFFAWGDALGEVSLPQSKYDVIAGHVEAVATWQRLLSAFTELPTSILSAALNEFVEKILRPILGAVGEDHTREFWCNLISQRDWNLSQFAPDESVWPYCVAGQFVRNAVREAETAAKWQAYSYDPTYRADLLEQAIGGISSAMFWYNKVGHPQDGQILRNFQGYVPGR